MYTVVLNHLSASPSSCKCSLVKSQGIESAKSIRSELGSESRQQVKKQPRPVIYVLFTWISQASARLTWISRWLETSVFPVLSTSPEFLCISYNIAQSLGTGVLISQQTFGLCLNWRNRNSWTPSPCTWHSSHKNFYICSYRLNCASHRQNDSHVVNLISSVWEYELIWKYSCWRCNYGFPGASEVKSLLVMQESQETCVRFLCREDPLEEGMATYSSILAGKIPWTEEPGELQCMGSQRTGHSWAPTHAHMKM